MATDDRYHITPQSIHDNHCFKCKCELMSTDYCSDADGMRYRSLEEECNLERGYNPDKPKTKKQMKEWSIGCDKFNKERYRVASDALKWENTGGYAGYYDMEKRTLVLCSRCTEEILGKYIRVNNLLYDKQGFHYHRRSERNDEEIKMRWKAYREKQALTKLLKNTHKEEKERRQM